MDISLFWSPKLKTLGLPSIASPPSLLLLLNQQFLLVHYWGSGVDTAQDDVNHWDKKHIPGVSFMSIISVYDPLKIMLWFLFF